MISSVQYKMIMTLLGGPFYLFLYNMPSFRSFTYRTFGFMDESLVKVFLRQIMPNCADLSIVQAVSLLQYPLTSLHGDVISWLSASLACSTCFIVILCKCIIGKLITIVQNETRNVWSMVYDSMYIITFWAVNYMYSHLSKFCLVSKLEM